MDPEVRSAIFKSTENLALVLEETYKTGDLPKILELYLSGLAKIQDYIEIKKESPKTGHKNPRTKHIATYAARYYYHITGKLPITPDDWGNQALVKTVHSICERFQKDPSGKNRNKIRGVRYQCKQAVLNLNEKNANLAAPYI